MLSDLHILIEDFEAAVRDCSQIVSESCKPSHRERHRMVDLGLDISGFVGVMANAHINATMWIVDQSRSDVDGFYGANICPEILSDIYAGKRDPTDDEKEEMARQNASGIEMLKRIVRRKESKVALKQEEATSHLKASYKAYFFFIRAFHDACYAVLLSLHGQDSGPHSSVSNCLKKKNEYSGMIATISGYEKWFVEFKRKRDVVKRGVNFGLVGPENDVGVLFNTVTTEGGLRSGDPKRDAYRIGDLIEAIRFSIELIKVIKSRAVELK